MPSTLLLSRPRADDDPRSSSVTCRPVVFPTSSDIIGQPPALVAAIGHSRRLFAPPSLIVVAVVVPCRRPSSLFAPPFLIVVAVVAPFLLLLPSLPLRAIYAPALQA
ncbi:hypothetical protein L210DRAFT_3651019 [Boletus edulis BED1]|uniref:Uncharacterized protein n=1 Tax=Boletus edulis BED1 TaxID=1328754 RepID=A0AAD4G9M8_BOLED|nr:hypothetical protein L210DRAFT_3651019 [Boletus edulis BED1]